MLQYIGARYVPIFYVNSVDPTSSEWENNVTYEPMTWVSLPNGHMYISKKEVPTSIGSPVSNPEYWLEAGQYNAYIQLLQDQIDNMQDGTIPGSLQDQINDIKDPTIPGSIQDQINDMKDGTIPGSLQDQITSNDTDIANIQKAMKRTAIYIGNSFTYGNGSSSGNRGLFALTKDLLFDQAYMYQAGAHGLVNYQAFTTNFLTLLQNAIASGDFNNNDITDVIFIGAYGDVRAYDSGITESSFLTNCIAIRTLIDNTFPNIKKVSYINAHAQYSFHAEGYLTNSSSPYRVNKMLARVCARSNIDYLGWIGWPLMYNTSFFATDNIHPNDNGYDILRGMFMTAYQGGDLVYTPYVLNTAIQFSGHICESYYEIDPEKVEFSIGRIDNRVGGVATPFTLTAGQTYQFNIPTPRMHFNPIFPRQGAKSIRIIDSTGNVGGIADVLFTDPTTYPNVAINWRGQTFTTSYDLYCIGFDLVAPWQ